MTSQETNFPALFLTDIQVASRYGISQPTVWRWARIGHLPPPESIGPNTRRWSVATLDKWDAEQADKRAQDFKRAQEAKRALAAKRKRAQEAA